MYLIPIRVPAAWAQEVRALFLKHDIHYLENAIGEREVVFNFYTIQEVEKAFFRDFAPLKRQMDSDEEDAFRQRWDWLLKRCWYKPWTWGGRKD